MTTPPETAAETTETEPRHGIAMPQRGALVAAAAGRQGGTLAALPGPELRFGFALWPYDLLLRFAWDLPEHEHVWPDDWFDDVFEHAARDLRSLGPKLIHALAAMITPLDTLKNAALEAELTREQVESAPLQVDLVLSYLSRLLDHVASVVPHCYGQDGRALAEGRGNLRRLAALPLGEVDPLLARLIAPDGQLPPVVDRFASPHAEVQSHSPDLYAMVNAPGFDTALPKAAARALRESADVSIAAADQIDAGLPALCAWLDTLLAHLIAMVCARAEDGDDLRERWAEPNWTVLQRMSFADTDAALALIRALPTIADGPDLIDDGAADDD